MQQGISRRDAYSPGVTAVIGGRSVEAVSVSVDRELPDPVGGGSLSAATASLSVVEGPDVAATVATPWDPATQWPPAPEVAASVSMSTAAGSVSLMAGGRVTDSSGGTSGRAVDVGVADAYQTLDRTISWEPFAAATPSMSEATTARYVGLQSIAVTDRIFRHCGWFSTPPALPYSVLSVPAQGTMWPERGTVVTSQAMVGAAFPGWLNTAWGVGVTDVTATYTVGGAYTIAARGSMELVALTANRAGEGASRIDVLGAGGVLLARLSWSETTGHVFLRDSSGAMTSAGVSLPRVDGLLYASIEFVSATSVKVTLRCGTASSTAPVTVPSVVTSTAVTDVTVVAASLSGGFQVAFPPTAGALASWKASAVLRPRSASRNTLMVLPSVEAENCADLLSAQCEAEAATYWIDETGVMQWWDLARLESQASVATLTSDDDIAEDGFTWSHDLSSVKSRVSVKWREPVRKWAWRTTVNLWQGDGESFDPEAAKTSDAAEEWLNVPDDEVWLGVDDQPRRIGVAGSGDAFNYGWGSWHGGVVPQEGGLPDRWAHLAGTLTYTLTKVNDRSWKTETTWTGTETVVMRTPDAETESSLWRTRREFDLPIIRGKAKYTFSDRVTYSTQTGASTAPEHEIDSGWWIQDQKQAQYTANYYGARVTVPQPVLSSVALVPLPGLQLGDVVTVQDTAVTRLTIRGVVIADSRSIDGDGSIDHSVTIRPLAVSRNGVLWEEWGRVVSPESYSTWGAGQSSKQWQAWGADPLAGEV